jgi:small nuclear ribonucleoprotein (snRNP)-like protein
MPIEYPEDLKPGEGLNNSPFETDEFLDFTAKMGGATGAFYGIVFQLPKWGFETFKVDEYIQVSPVFAQYYQLTIQQKQQLEAQINQALSNISTAVANLELAMHDLRKYKEFMDYFTMIDKGKEMKDKKKGEELMAQGEQSLKSIFIDQVDAHTDLPNIPIALRSIVTRWPTIIADFMRLKDEDVVAEKIAKDYGVSEAQGVVLATKNKLYKEWRDQLFKNTVKERFESLVKMTEARKKSLEENKKALKPLIAKHMAIKESLESEEGRASYQKASYWKPDAQAISIDGVTIWAWKPFAPSEKYKYSRELPFDEIPARKAGFTKDEIKKLHGELDEKDEEGKVTKKWSETVKALPAEPSVDNVLRDIIKDIEKEYGVKIELKDILEAREQLLKKFKSSVKGLGAFESWIFSPYFVFYEMPMDRTVLRFPNGEEFEDLGIGNLKGYLQTQNIVLGHYIELIARDKQLEHHINQMLGEMGVKGESIENIMKEMLYKTSEEIEQEKKNKLSESVEKAGNIFTGIREGISKFFDFFGMDVAFFRGSALYEMAFANRIPKMYLAEVGRTFSQLVNYFKASFGVPGFGGV